MFGVKIALGALTFLNALYQSYAATCTTFTSEFSCIQTNMCAWSSSVGCYCNANTNLEVVFVMDSSYSVESWGWTSEKTFVKNVINTGLTQGSYVGVVSFSTSSSIKYNFNGVQQPRTSVINLVNSLPFLNGYTDTLEAVEDAVTIFQTTTKSLQRIMFLITDGNPNPSTNNPCGTGNSAKNVRKNLKTWNVTTLLITVGSDINAGTLSCLYDNDPSRVIAANDFSASSLEAIRAKTDAYLCPTTSDLRISEVRVEISITGDPGGKSRFLEIYNHGQIIDFSGNNMKLTGFVTGTISSGVLQNGQRLVIYDNSGTAGTDMQCNSCTCAAEETNSAGTLTNNRCTNAVYIACGSAGASCSFSSTMSNTQWSQKIEDTIDHVVWVDVSHSATNSLATVSKGYTFEVIDPLKDATTGSNWKRSCLMYGTPGAKPLSTCTATCVDSVCRSSGDTSAVCSSGVCSCTASNHYYSDGLQCTKLPPPSGCTTTIGKEPDGFQYATVAWTATGLTLDHTYSVSYTYEGAGAQTTVASDTPYTVYGPNGINVQTDPAPTVKTVVDVNNVIVESVAVSCPFQTQAPTLNPTYAPTNKPTLRPTIQPTKKPTSPPTGRPSTPPTQAPTKKPTVKPTEHPTVSGYAITSCSIVVKAGSTSDITVTYTLEKYTTVSDTDEGLTLELNLDGASGRGAVFLSASSGSPQDTSITSAASHTFYLWPRYRTYATSGPFTGFSRGSSCSVTTSAPTPAPTKKPTVPPTKKPTKPPTKKPTGKPSLPPTPKPTYQTVAVESCAITLGRLDGNGKITNVVVEFTEPTLNPPTTPNSSDLAYLVAWGSGGEESFGVPSKGSGEVVTYSAKNILITKDSIVYITPRTKNPSNPSTSVPAGPSTQCTLITLAPTVSPTNAPLSPTASPVIPNINLALNDRCVKGTVDDNGRDIYVCEYEVSDGPYDLSVELTTGASDFEVEYQWEITFDSSIEPKFELSADAAIAPESDFNILKGTNTIEDSTTSGKFSFFVSRKSDEDIAAEVAWLTLTSCTYNEDDICTIAALETHRKTYRLLVVSDKGGKQTSASNKGKMPTWIWYPVAAGILMLAGLAAFGYMYYNKRRLAEEQLQQKEADLANAEELDNMENFGGLGDNITFNPIATAGTQDVATGGEYIDKQLAKQQKHAEFAQVDVDKEVWRQDFGQIKADRHEV